MRCRAGLFLHRRGGNGIGWGSGMIPAGTAGSTLALFIADIIGIADFDRKKSGDC